MFHTWVPQPESVDDLDVERLRSRHRVNEFIRRWHSMGPVPGWKSVIGAMFDGGIVAVVVFGRHYHPDYDTDDRLAITRYCSREDRPPNTGSWLLARAREWAKSEEYREIVTYSGVAGNPGTVYDAAGFECVEMSDADGATWTARDDRGTRDDFIRKKWVYRL